MGACKYLLDTNILSDLINHPMGAAADKIALVGEGAICTSIIVACEMRFGSVKKGSPILTTRVDKLLERIESFLASSGMSAPDSYFRLLITIT